MTLSTGKARTFNIRNFRDLSARYGGRVADTTALAAIPAARRVDNMVVLAGTDFYYFDDDAVSGSVAPAVGTGYWKIVTEGESVLTSLAAAGGAALVGLTDTYSKITGTTLQALVNELTTTTGAAMVGVADAAANFDATDVEAALAEIMAIFAAVTNGKGASKVGVEDSAGDLTAVNVETALAELRHLAQHETITNAAAPATALGTCVDDSATPANPSTQIDFPQTLDVAFDANCDGTSVTVSGIAPDGSAVSEVFATSAGATVNGTKVFAKITASGGIVSSGDGTGTQGTATVQTSGTIGLPRKNATVTKLLADATDEAATQDATAIAEGYFTPTSAKDGATVHDVWYY